MNKIIILFATLTFLVGCNPTVRLEVPKEPIRIEANITIKHEIKIVIAKEVDEMFEEENGLF